MSSLMNTDLFDVFTPTKVGLTFFSDAARHYKCIFEAVADLIDNIRDLLLKQSKWRTTYVNLIPEKINNDHFKFKWSFVNDGNAIETVEEMDRCFSIACSEKRDNNDTFGMYGIALKTASMYLGSTFLFISQNPVTKTKILGFFSQKMMQELGSYSLHISMDMNEDVTETVLKTREMILKYSPFDSWEDVENQCQLISSRRGGSVLQIYANATEYSDKYQGLCNDDVYDITDDDFVIKRDQCKTFGFGVGYFPEENPPRISQYLRDYLSVLYHVDRSKLSATDIFNISIKGKLVKQVSLLEEENMQFIQFNNNHLSSSDTTATWMSHDDFVNKGKPSSCRHLLTKLLNDNPRLLKKGISKIAKIFVFERNYTAQHGTKYNGLMKGFKPVVCIWVKGRLTGFQKAGTNLQNSTVSNYSITHVFCDYLIPNSTKNAVIATKPLQSVMGKVRKALTYFRPDKKSRSRKPRKRKIPFIVEDEESEESEESKEIQKDAETQQHTRRSIERPLQQPVENEKEEEYDDSLDSLDSFSENSTVRKRKRDAVEDFIGENVDTYDNNNNNNDDNDDTSNIPHRKRKTITIVSDTLAEPLSDGSRLPVVDYGLFWEKVFDNSEKIRKYNRNLSNNFGENIMLKDEFVDVVKLISEIYGIEIEK